MLIGGPTRIFSASREEHLSKEPTFCLTGFSYLRPISHHVRSRSLSERKKAPWAGQEAEQEAAEGGREAELLWTFFRRATQWISALFHSTPHSAYSAGIRR